MRRRNVQIAVVMFLVGAAMGSMVFKSLWILVATAAPLLISLSIMSFIGNKALRRFRRF